MQPGFMLFSVAQLYLYKLTKFGYILHICLTRLLTQLTIVVYITLQLTFRLKFRYIYILLHLHNVYIISDCIYITFIIHLQYIYSIILQKYIRQSYTSPEVQLHIYTRLFLVFFPLLVLCLTHTRERSARVVSRCLLRVCFIASQG